MAVQNVDRGVVLLAIGSGTSVGYAMANAGASGTPRIVTSGVFRASDVFAAGFASEADITITANVGPTAFGANVVVERGRLDVTNASGAIFSGGTKWATVGSIRTDLAIVASGLTPFPVTQQTILSGHLAGRRVDPSTGTLNSGSAVEGLSVTLRTSDLKNATGGGRVLVGACSGALLSGDYVIVSVEAG